MEFYCTSFVAPKGPNVNKLYCSWSKHSTDRAKKDCKGGGHYSGRGRILYLVSLRILHCKTKKQCNTGVLSDSTFLVREVVQIGKQLLILRKIILPSYSGSSSLSVGYNFSLIR